MTAFLRIGGLLLLPGAAWAVNVSGDWTIESSVGTTWDYDVIFNGSPGHVGFLAQSISERTMTGTLLLSGNPAPFTAKRRGSDSSGP
jgi:hypothetical protein